MPRSILSGFLHRPNRQEIAGGASSGAPATKSESFLYKCAHSQFSGQDWRFGEGAADGQDAAHRGLEQIVWFFHRVGGEGGTDNRKRLVGLSFASKFERN